MAPRFASIKFNLLRAIEIFQDLNHEDMDVTAPPSAPNFFKEHDLAEKLHKYLQHLVNDGFFDDCDLREPEESVADEEEDEYEDEEPDEEQASSSSGEEYSSTPRSEGFEASVEREHDRRGSRDSLTDRFKRYVRRIMPGNSKRSSSGRHHRRHNSRSDSGSDSDDTHHHTTTTSSREHGSISKE